MIGKNKLQVYRKTILLSVVLVLSGLGVIIFFSTFFRTSQRSIDSEFAANYPGPSASPVVTTEPVLVATNGFGSNIKSSFIVPNGYEEASSSATFKLFNKKTNGLIESQIRVLITRNTQKNSLDQAAEKFKNDRVGLIVQDEIVWVREFEGRKVTFLNEDKSKIIMHYIMAIPRARVLVIPTEFHEITLARSIDPLTIDLELNDKVGLIQQDMDDFMQRYLLEEAQEIY